MLYRLCQRLGHNNLCVLRVAENALDIPGALISDVNAACGYARFESSPAGLRMLNADHIYAQSWYHEDPYVRQRNGQRLQAELLIPDQIGASKITGIYVSSNETAAWLRGQGVHLEIVVDRYLFFL